MTRRRRIVALAKELREIFVADRLRLDQKSKNFAGLGRDLVRQVGGNGENLANTLNGFVQEVCPVSRPLKKESQRLARTKG